MEVLRRREASLPRHFGYEVGRQAPNGAPTLIKLYISLIETHTSFDFELMLRVCIQSLTNPNAPRIDSEKGFINDDVESSKSSGSRGSQDLRLPLIR